MASHTRDVPADDVTKPHIADLNPMHIGIIIVAGMFVTTLAQPGVLGKLPLQNFLKNSLHVQRGDMAGFFFLIGLAWYFKPFAGILTDAFPLFRTRRRSYLLICSILAGASWLALGALPHTYSTLLDSAIVINVFMVVCSTVVGAYLVEAGQRMASTGRLSSLRQATMSFCQLINGPIGGWLASPIPISILGVGLIGIGTASSLKGMGLALPAIACALCLFAIFPVAWVFMRERPTLLPDGDPLGPAKHQLGIIVRARSLWIAILFVGLYYFAPGFVTVLFYRQQDVLHMSTVQQGLLGTYAGGMGILSTVVYAFCIRRFPIRWMLIAAVSFAALSTLLYLFYNSPTAANLIEAQNGFFGTFAEVVLLDLAARSTPAGCEGLGYSLILSMRNLSLFGADKVGAQLADKYKLPFETMVWLNAGTTAVVLILIPLLPKVLMMGKDEKRSATSAAAA